MHGVGDLGGAPRVDGAAVYEEAFAGFGGLRAEGRGFEHFSEDVLDVMGLGENSDDAFLGGGCISRLWFWWDWSLVLWKFEGEGSFSEDWLCYCG